ncbi:hypothetical protein LRS06_01820 [Hymenobacter sp. J193]|uniref:hypothetical protein n=1 Tax=Hymenobacter sp. J193 TaxID=2898429 RepID=UPI00215120E2|nr:hypothetical protein [Hymenobacter sp. J193]MCR5886529.1 hypothetical protein [Hymenobacter sp. J193]
MCLPLFRRFRRILPGLLLASAGLLSSCETSRRQSFPEVSSPVNDPTKTEQRQLEATSKLVADIAEGKTQYSIPRDQLTHNFIREFADGTVVDKVMIRKVQERPKDAPVYYLVGLGLKDGMFRGMAIPLRKSSDNSLYLSSNTERYILEGVGCTFCFFNFQGNKIVGTTCEENTGGSSCDLTVKDNNTFFR